MTAMMRVWILFLLSALASGFLTSTTNALGHCIQMGVESRAAKINHMMAMKNDKEVCKKKKKPMKNKNNNFEKRKNLMPPPARGNKVDKTEKDENLFSFPNFRDCERVTK